MTPSSSCSLCSLPVPFALCEEGGLKFCCHGCMAVYQVLSHRGELENYQHSTVFRQAVSSGLISNPSLLEKLRAQEAVHAGQPSEKLYCLIADLWCPSCAEVISWILRQQKGVLSCFIDYSTDCATITYRPVQISIDKIFETIRSIGYQPAFINSQQEGKIPLLLWLRSGIAAFCALHLMMFSSPLYVSYWNEEQVGYTALFQLLSLLVSVPIVTYCMMPLYRRALAALRVGVIGMEALVVMSVLASFFYSVWQMWIQKNALYFDSMAVIVTLVLVGKILEIRAKFSAKEAFFQLLRALPRKGRRVFQDGREEVVLLKEVPVGATMVARSGEKIVLDGEVIQGEGAVDESVIRGETIPVLKRAGAFVIAGSLVRRGRLLFRVTADSAQTLLQQMLNMIEKDVEKKEGMERLTDRISAWFVPLVILLSLLTAGIMLLQGVGSSAVLLRVLSILLIACPCAIGIAAPLAHSYLLRAMAMQGAVVRNRNALAFLGRPTLFVCDKTGTLTLGRYSLLCGLENLSIEQRKVLKGMATHSIHPISCALVEAIQEEAQELAFVEEILGKGLRATHEEKKLCLGSGTWLLQEGYALPEINQETENDLILSTVYFAWDEKSVYALLLGDQLRPGAAELVKALSPCPVLILSGDHSDAVSQVAKRCGCRDWKANCLPLDKRTCIEEKRAQGEIVLMLGDGVNDAMALAHAHVGICVASATEVSTHVSDILLTHEGLQGVVDLLHLAQKGERILRQNIFWSFFYNIVGIVLAINGLLSPLFAAAAMLLSSLIVLWNASRLSPEKQGVWKGWD